MVFIIRENMLVPISEIKVNAGRREADPEGVQELVDSISKVGLLNPITIDREHTLIAGLHRLEAAKLLGWTEIECNVSSLEGLLAELAEVDENVVRKGLSAVEYSDLLAHLSGYGPQIGQNVGDTEKRGLAIVLHQIRGPARLGHHVAAPEAELRLGIGLRQPAHQIRAVQVARGLARYKIVSHSADF